MDFRICHLHDYVGTPFFLHSHEGGSEDGGGVDKDNT